MNFSMGHGFSVGHTVSHAFRLDQAQSVVLQQAMLQRQRELVEAVRGRRYQPRCVCHNPNCAHEFTDLEILIGFRDDPNDYTTECPKCRLRSEPRLYASTQYSRVDMAYYCPTQTLERLKALSKLPVDDIRVVHSAVYNSAVTHFGGLKQAFARLGLKYAFEANLDWRKHVGPFLGKLPDAVIARLLGAGAGQVRRLRNSKGIKPFRARDLLDEGAGILTEHVDDGLSKESSEPTG